MVPISDVVGEGRSKARYNAHCARAGHKKKRKGQKKTTTAMTQSPDTQQHDTTQRNTTNKSKRMATNIEPCVVVLPWRKKYNYLLSRQRILQVPSGRIVRPLARTMILWFTPKYLSSISSINGWMPLF